MIFFLNQKVDAPVVVALRILAYRVKLEGASLATWTSFQQFPSGGPTLWNNVKYPSCLSGKSSINGGFVQCLSLFSVPKTQKKTTSNQFRPRFWSKKLGQCATFIGAPVRMIHVPFFLDHARGQRQQQLQLVVPFPQSASKPGSSVQVVPVERESHRHFPWWWESTPCWRSTFQKAHPIWWVPPPQGGVSRLKSHGCKIWRWFHYWFTAMRIMIHE